MTIDKSLKVKAGMGKVRNVYKRAERLAQLKEADRWKDGDPLMGSPKVRVLKISMKKKKKEKKEGEEGAKAAPAAKGAAAKAPAAKAPAAKAAAPAPKKK
jgi:small basic protein (TIGR04137 family)